MLEIRGQESLLFLYDGILLVFRGAHKNFKFELAFFILENSQACREYLASKYKMIFIDEYQDSDLKMNDLFMFLNSSLGIDIFIVGDTKQAIYLWRGASEDIFNKIPQKMEQKYLWHNFRSHPEIVNYAMVIHDPESLPVVSKDLDEHVVIVNLGIHSLGELLKTKLIDLDKGITIIVKKNNEALVYKDKLRNEGFARIIHR
ncbi:UvrD-helicase domain-containing protein [Streptococcus danieliae]|uniref:UvrD-helicase domain-containing protein n=1 Tax=Streptococcus danieliae TaxID=747656 RepID=A0A7Z0LEE7_9STRE|nr:UvrD-helicase domain-containing protein [Streptococcus danieliae]MBF0717915.1 UvrD-helicase domain-containing protein [Streptococcus danieliae]NYS49845.1 UvrD-helicase domain-containing protein [Streptococcus danieliae]